MNDVTHIGGGGSAKRWHFSINLYSKMGDKGEGRGKKSQKLVDVIYGQPPKILLLPMAFMHAAIPTPMSLAYLPRNVSSSKPSSWVASSIEVLKTILKTMMLNTAVNTRPN